MRVAVVVGVIALLVVGAATFLFAVTSSEPTCGERRQELVEAKAARQRDDSAARRGAVAVRAQEARSAGCAVDDLVDSSVGA